MSQPSMCDLIMLSLYDSCERNGIEMVLKIQLHGQRYAYTLDGPADPKTEADPQIRNAKVQQCLARSGLYRQALWLATGLAPQEWEVRRTTGPLNDDEEAVLNDLNTALDACRESQDVPALRRLLARLSTEVFERDREGDSLGGIRRVLRSESTSQRITAPMVTRKEKRDN